MRVTLILFVVMLVFASKSLAQGSGNEDITGTYKVHKKTGPFFKRWYCNLNSESTTKYFEVLHLKENNEYYHFLSSTCMPEEATGTWKQEGKFLVLQADSTSGLYFSGEKKYKMKRRSLSLQDDNPVIKKKHFALRKL